MSEGAPLYTGHNLLFVVGAPRSGTTWVQRLLAAHPRIHTGQESKLFRSYLSPQLKAWRWEVARERDQASATGRGGTGLSCYFEEEHFLKVLRDYTRRLLDPMVGNLAPGEWFLEKTPAHALCLEDIRLLLPDARVIHVLRDGRDVVASLLAASRSWGAGWAPRATRDAATTWVRHVRAVRQAASQFPPTHFCELTYEQLAADTAGMLRRLAAFLSLEWSDEEIAAAVRANAAEELRQGRGTAIPRGGRFADAEGVKDPPDFIRRAAPGGWRQDLSPFQKLVVRRIAGQLLRELGYMSSSAGGANSVFSIRNPQSAIDGGVGPHGKLREGDHHRASKP